MAFGQIHKRTTGRNIIHASVTAKVIVRYIGRRTRCADVKHAQFSGGNVCDGNMKVSVLNYKSLWISIRE
jgi:hypothetical protein